ncbi:MAG: tetratricopeptide repeat protein [Acidobacteriia bacterium]|nr:tetratricopeptide repeat protein [Terriglobia bacterium]
MDSHPSLPSTGPADVLDSWKVIANYLNRDIRTVMRWHRSGGLPVHRLPGGAKPGVYALKSELENWRKSNRIHAIEPDQGSPPPVSARVPSVAVLPFVNLSDEKENEYFGDGLADEIINGLTRVEGLRVTARTSSFRFRGQEHDVREIGARLGVAALLEGSVQRVGSRVRIRAQLVSSTDGYHLWSDRYDAELADVFAVQDQIARSIAAALKLKLGPPTASRRATIPEAYNLWLKGRCHQLSRRSIEDLMKAGECFSQAVALDPNCAVAHLGLAQHVCNLAILGLVSPQQVAARGRAALEKALELDDSMGEAHAVMGSLRAFLDFDWRGAEHCFSEALARNPGSPLVHSQYAAFVLMPTRRLERAEAEVGSTLELDPLSPDSHFLMALVYFFQGRCDRAQANIQIATEFGADTPSLEWLSGIIEAVQGRFDSAIARCENAVRRFGGSPMVTGALGMLYGWAGRHDDARRLLAQLEQAARVTYVSPIYRAWVYAGLGENARAFEWLDRAVEGRDPHVLHLPVKPVYDKLRGDPRFAALLRKMRLEN